MKMTGFRMFVIHKYYHYVMRPDKKFLVQNSGFLCFKKDVDIVVE